MSIMYKLPFFGYWLKEHEVMRGERYAECLIGRGYPIEDVLSYAEDHVDDGVEYIGMVRACKRMLDDLE